MKKCIKLYAFFVVLFSCYTLFAQENNTIASKNYNTNKTSACPLPTVITPIYLCRNSSTTQLTATALTGNTLNWYVSSIGGVPSPIAPTPTTTTVGTITYYVSQTDGVCESARVGIVVNVVADTGTTNRPLVCDPTQILPADKNSSVFFDWGNVPGNPNAYNVSYSIQGGPIMTGYTTLSHWQVFGMLPGQSATLTLTHATLPCIPAQTITCSVPCGTSTVTPTFAPMQTSYCLNDPPPVLPTTSTNVPPITGTWSPSPVVTSAMGTIKYTFIPDPILFPCALKTTSIDITIGPIEPDFTDLTICSGDAAPILETTSPNGITGSWNPPIVDNLTSGVYVFTPDPGQPCTPTNKSINVTVNPSNTILGINWTVTDAFTKNQIVTVTNPVGANYSYQMDSGPFQASPVFENVAIGTHSITVNDVNGCSEITNNDVLVIGYPRYFTPNGDNYNDTWNIPDLNDISSNSRIYIFDRYGKLLKDLSPEGLGWDGTYLSKPVPADDYWFTVEYVEESVLKKYKSHFSLKR